MRIGIISTMIALVCMAISSAQQDGGRGNPPSPGLPDNEELARLFEDDQADRRPKDGGAIDPAALVARDRQREARVKALYRAGDLRTGKDYYRAAMVLQHASEPEDNLVAHEFCVVALAKGERSARWLAAATEDRFLIRMRRPQRFGAEFR